MNNYQGGSLTGCSVELHTFLVVQNFSTAEAGRDTGGKGTNKHACIQVLARASMHLACMLTSLRLCVIRGLRLIFGIICLSYTVELLFAREIRLPGNTSPSNQTVSQGNGQCGT